MIRLAILPLSLLLVAAGCRATQPIMDDTGEDTGPTSQAPMSDLGEVFVLEVGAHAMVDGHTIRFDSVLEDSRCPTDVDCVWEGRATVSLALIADDIVSDVQLSIPGYANADSEPQDAQSATVGGYRLTLLQLDPYPAADGQGSSAIAKATLRMTRGG